MCTVTFTPNSISNFILTSNRDEAPNRNTIPPRVYANGKIKLLYPKDEVAGGTWMGASDQKRLICLLNGGFEAHTRKDRYRMSRGVVVTQLLTEPDAVAIMHEIDLLDIEPFTVVMVDWSKSLEVLEWVWDGEHKHFEEKPLAPHIWSSSLLYSSEEKRKREEWFSNFLFDHMSPSEEELLTFHRSAGDGNRETNLIMDRGFVKTKSISQFVKNDDDICFKYEDLQSHEITMTSF